MRKLMRDGASRRESSEQASKWASKQKQVA